jgi:hypothetical protein
MASPVWYYSGWDLYRGDMVPQVVFFTLDGLGGGSINFGYLPG